MVSKKKGNLEDSGFLYITYKKNNTITTYTDSKGNVLLSYSVGMMKVSNVKNNSTILICDSVKYIIKLLIEKGVTSFRVVHKGVSNSRDKVMNIVMQSDIGVISIEEKTRVAHGGCRMRRHKRN